MKKVLIMIICLYSFVFALNAQTTIDGKLAKAKARVEKEVKFEVNSVKIKKKGYYFYINDKPGMYFTLSPDRNKISFIEEGKSIEKKNDDGTLSVSGEEGRKLTVLDNLGIMLGQINDAREYCWSPDSSKIAVIVGTYDPNAEIGFMPKSLVMYEINSKTYINIDKPFMHVFWSKHDNCIYLEQMKTGKVTKLNPETKVMEETSYHGIYFSPDGKYYYDMPYDFEYFQIY